MNYRVNLLTATKKGLDQFRFDLQKEQIRKSFVKSAQNQLQNNGPRTKAHRVAKTILSNPEPYLEDAVAKWNEDQTNAYDQRIVKATEEAKAQLESSNALASLSVHADLAMTRLAAQNGKANVYRIARYLGELNRDISEARVDMFSEDMVEGRWWFTPDPVVVTDDGFIINGQHRLLAAERVIDVIYNRATGELSETHKSYMPPEFVVVWGVDKKAALLMDEAKRSAEDRRSIAVRYASAVG